MQLRISKVVVGDRARDSLGKLNALKASIQADGLRDPLLVTEEGQLLSGERRLAACTELEWVNIPVHVVSGAHEAADLMVKERENATHARPMTFTESSRVADVLIKFDEPAAAERTARQRSAAGRRTKSGTPDSRTPEQQAHDALLIDVVASRAVGVARSALYRVKYIRNAQHWRPDPQRVPDEKAQVVRNLAVEVMVTADRSGRLTNGYEAVRRAISVAEGKAGREIPAAEQRAILDGTTATLRGLLVALKPLTELKDLDPALTDAEREAWERDLKTAQTLIIRSRNLLKKPTPKGSIDGE